MAARLAWPTGLDPADIVPSDYARRRYRTWGESMALDSRDTTGMSSNHAYLLSSPLYCIQTAGRGDEPLTVGSRSPILNLRAVGVV